MDGLGVSQQMQVKFEVSATSGPGCFSVCVCTRTCMCVCVRVSEGGKRAWEGWGPGACAWAELLCGAGGQQQPAPVPAALALMCCRIWLPSNPPGKVSPFCSTGGNRGLKKRLPQKQGHEGARGSWHIPARGRRSPEWTWPLEGPRDPLTLRHPDRTPLLAGHPAAPSKLFSPLPPRRPLRDWQVSHRALKSPEPHAPTGSSRPPERGLGAVTQPHVLAW